LPPAMESTTYSEDMSKVEKQVIAILHSWYRRPARDVSSCVEPKVSCTSLIQLYVTLRASCNRAYARLYESGSVVEAKKRPQIRAEDT
jgi:hypothetical protein